MGCFTVSELFSLGQIFTLGVVIVRTASRALGNRIPARSGPPPMHQECPSPRLASMTRHHLTTWVRAHPVAALLAWFFPVGWAIAFIPVIANRPDGLPQE